jgi:hypothetical protein
MLRFQTMLFPDAPMRSSEPANSQHPPPDADPAKVALAILHFCATRTRPEKRHRPVETRTASEPVIPKFECWIIAPPGEHRGGFFMSAIRFVLHPTQRIV